MYFFYKFQIKKNYQSLVTLILIFHQFVNQWYRHSFFYYTKISFVYFLVFTISPHPPSLYDLIFNLEILINFKYFMSSCFLDLFMCCSEINFIIQGMWYFICSNVINYNFKPITVDEKSWKIMNSFLNLPMLILVPILNFIQSKIQLEIIAEFSFVFRLTYF